MEMKYHARAQRNATGKCAEGLRDLGETDEKQMGKMRNQTMK